MKTALAIASLIFYITVNIYVILETYITLQQILPTMRPTCAPHSPHIRRRARAGMSSGMSSGMRKGYNIEETEVLDYCVKRKNCDGCIFWDGIICKAELKEVN